MQFTIISYIAIITLFVAIIFLKKKNNGLLFSIIILNAVTETILSINNNLICTMLYCYIHFILWFCLLFKIFKEKRQLKYILLFYSLFCLLNWLCREDLKSFNNYSFALGTFIYVFLFIIFSFKFLKQENFNFFTSNHCLLVSSPVIFLLGMSFLFAFDSSELFSVKIYKETVVYTIVAYFVNFIYYSLINLYIYKENKKSHVQV
jgi:hypothetical protein